jgi:uncharacterized OsmC-like protein
MLTLVEIRCRRRASSGRAGVRAPADSGPQNEGVSTTAIRCYAVDAHSTDVFGRVLCDCREHHFVVDGPVHNGCPGEEVTPAELFLAGIAACGVELLQVFAREEALRLRKVDVAIAGEIEPEHPVRPDLTLFNRVRLAFQVEGVTEDEAERLVARFKGR